MADIGKVFEILETSQDWQLLSATVEQAQEAVGAIEDSTEKAGYFYRLGGIWERTFIRKDIAMKNFQLAWKSSPQSQEGVRALGNARRIYREMGNLKMVAQLLSLELKATQDPARRADSLLLLGQVLLDLRQHDDAVAAFRQALEARPGDPSATAALEMFDYQGDAWMERVLARAEEAETADDVRAAELYLACARIYLQEEPESPDIEKYLRRAVDAVPDHPAANFLLEQVLSDKGRWGEIAMLHDARAQRAPEGPARAELWADFAALWGHRFNNVEKSKELYLNALRSEAANARALSFFRGLAAASGDWRQLVELCREGYERATDAPTRVKLATELAVIHWRSVNDVEGARAYFGHVRALGGAPAELAAFEREHGAVVASMAAGGSGAHPAVGHGGGGGSGNGAAGGGAGGGGDGRDGDGDGDGDGRDAPPAAVAADAAPAAKAAAAAAAPPPPPPPSAPAAEEPPEPLPADLQKEIGDLTAAGNWQKLAETLRKGAGRVSKPRTKIALLQHAADVFRDKLKLDAQVTTVLNEILKIDTNYLPALEALSAQYENMKRWPDLIKVLKTRADLLRERLDQGDESVRAELVGLYNQRADLFLERFSNQAEAIKVFEALLEVDSTSVRALDYLSDMYEKRRDWERLLTVKGKKAALIEDPDARLRALLENASLATERLKRPNVLVALWQDILAVQPDCEPALIALEGLHEKAREWEQLGDICTRRVALTQDVEERKKLLQKLGVIYGERINQPERCIAAWRELLILEPGNKRAQDALKKKYLEVRDYDSLEEFYAETGKWDEFIRLLEREASTADNDLAKGKITYKVGELWLTKLDKADRALKAFEKVFEFDANNEKAALALIPIYQAAGKWDRLAAMMEIKLGHLTDAAERLQLTLDIARIYEGQLANAGAALQWFMRAHVEDPTRDDIRDEVERLAGTTRNWASAAQAFEGGISRYAGAPEALSLELRCARVHESELRQPEPALAHYVAALRIDANNAVALDGAERLYETLKRWQDLLGILGRKAQLAPNDAARVQLLYKIAAIHETQLDQKDQAIAAYQQILSIAGEDLKALEALDRLYEKKSDWPALAGVMERELAEVARHTPEVPAAAEVPTDRDDEEGEDAQAARKAAAGARNEAIKQRKAMQGRTVQIKFRLGQVREKHLGEPAKAVACYREIFPIEPKHEGARVALEGLLKSQAAHKLEIADILEPVYPHFEMWQALIEVHFIQLGAAKDGGRKAEVLGKIGEVQSAKLGDHKAAFKTLTECFTLNPREAKTYKRLENAAAGLGNWEDLVKLYRSTADEQGKSDPALAKRLRLRVASLYGERLGDVAGAEKAFKEALKESPEDLEALDGLGSLYAATNQWGECLKVYARKIELAGEVARRVGLFFEVAQIEEEKLGDRGAAIKTYQKILLLDAKSMDALRALERLFGAQKQWDDLAANLERQLELAEASEDVVALKYRLARLREGEMRQTAAAVEIYKEILSLDPDHADTTAAMERLLGDDAHQLQVSRILEPLYEQKGLWPKVIGAYEIQIKHSPPPERVELLHKIARLQESQLQSPREAFAAYARALREDAADQPTQNELDRIGAELNDYPGLVAVYEAVGAALVDHALAVEVWMKAAHLQEDVLESPEGAERCYAQVVVHDPHHLDAIRALKRLYSSREKWTEYVDVLMKEADCLTELDEQKTILAEAARVTEEVLHSQEGAIAVYRKVLEKDERDKHALEQLERLFAETERWEDLAGIYQRKADLAEDDPDARKAAYFQMGAVYETALQQPDKAIETFRTVLDMDPEDGTALEALDRLCVATAKWPDLLAILERRVALADDPIRLKYRMGEVLETKLAEPVRAIETYREVLGSAPDDEETIAALERLRKSGSERLFAAQVLEPIYETGSEFRKLVDVYETMLELAEEPEKRVELNLVIADLWESKLDQPQPAFEGLVRAVKDDPTNERVLELLERLAGRNEGGWRALVTKMEEQLAGIQIPENAVEVCRRIARIAEIHLEANDDAIAKYEKILELDAADADAIASLDRLYHEKQDWAKLAGILLKQIERADESEARQQLLFRLAQLRQTALGELELAIDNYREILELNEAHEPTLAALEALFTESKMRPQIGAILDPLYRAQGEWEKLVRVHQDLLEDVKEEEARLRAIRTIAELYEEKLTDQASALAWWGQAFREAPGNEAVNEELDRLARETSSWESVCGLFEEKLAKADEEKLDPALRKK
ncbi:MAG TPA: tetratricopeptide repeat protein, partial [Myxococcota bacterium]|nr:tetratricopeptide repeat protein [Myxococcota bacterium]